MLCPYCHESLSGGDEAYAEHSGQCEQCISAAFENNGEIDQPTAQDEDYGNALNGGDPTDYGAALNGGDPTDYGYALNEGEHQTGDDPTDYAEALNTSQEDQDEAIEPAWYDGMWTDIKGSFFDVFTYTFANQRRGSRKRIIRKGDTTVIETEYL